MLITEGIPLRDVRDILVAARKHKTVLLGGNTPGVIFPPEGIKVGMLPDVFYPEEVSPGKAGPKGVTIVSRSGAILYHMSDALAIATEFTVKSALQRWLGDVIQTERVTVEAVDSELQVVVAYHNLMDGTAQEATFTSPTGGV